MITLFHLVMVVVPLWKMEWLPVDGATSSNLHRLIMKLREWQENAINVCLPAFAEGRKFFVIEGCTGGGKTLAAAEISIRTVTREDADLIVVLSPNCGTKVSWKKTFEGLDIGGKRVNVTDSTSFPRDAQVWVSTYAGYSKVEEALQDRPTMGIIAIIDELHHAEESAEWGKAVDRLASLSDHVIFLSGTPWRREGKIAVLCNANNINGKPYYQDDGRIEADFVYNYRSDLRNPNTRGTVPVKFKFWDSHWQSPDLKTTEFLSKDLPLFPTDQFQDIDEWYEWAQKCDSSLGKHLEFDPDKHSPSHNKLIYSIIEESLMLLLQTRKQIESACDRKNLSILLCVAKNIKDARKIAEYIQEIRPSFRVSVVASDDSNGGKKLEKIAKQCKENASDKPDVIVSIGMISEGVDIPQIKVVAYMSAILTVLYFIQVVGRAIRRIPIGMPDQPYADVNLSDTVAYVVAPAHPKLRYIARNIEKDVRDTCGELPEYKPGDFVSDRDKPQNKAVGTVTSGDKSSSMFRGSEDFAQWHEIAEAIKNHERASDCYIDSHWVEYILGLFLRGDENAYAYAESEIKAKCKCLNVSMDEMVDKVEQEIETVLSYEEEQKSLSTKAMYWTNTIRFKIDKYRSINDNDMAFRKVRGDINRRAGLHQQGVSFTRASLEQKHEWIKCAKAIAEGAS